MIIYKLVKKLFKKRSNILFQWEDNNNTFKYHYFIKGPNKTIYHYFNDYNLLDFSEKYIDYLKLKNYRIVSKEYVKYMKKLITHPYKVENRLLVGLGEISLFSFKCPDGIIRSIYLRTNFAKKGEAILNLNKIEILDKHLLKNTFNNIPIYNYVWWFNNFIYYNSFNYYLFNSHLFSKY